MREQNNQPAGERIAKVMARVGLCSRREAEAWIAAGRVAVNGGVIASPALNVTSRDEIAVDGRPLPARERTRLFLYHKPVGLVTTHADPGGRPTIFASLPVGLPRLISVGRLDLSTEGLLLLTNDGGLARTLELPATGWLRRYRVRAHGKVQQEDLAALRSGITIDGVRYGAIDAALDREQGSNVWLTFAMREGKNREVKNVLGHLGLRVNRLIRVSFGPFQLGDLAEGAIEEVKTRVLREQIGERVAAQAGADFSAPFSPIPSAKGEGGRIAAGREARREPANAPARKFPARPPAATTLPVRGRNEGTAKGRNKKVGRERDQHVTRGRDKKPRRVDDHIGEPEKARREKRRGRRLRRDKSR
jgi:23S rRNA pseudouridine2605 synthase